MGHSLLQKDFGTRTKNILVISLGKDLFRQGQSAYTSLQLVYKKSSPISLLLRLIKKGEFIIKKKSLVTNTMGLRSQDT